MTKRRILRLTKREQQIMAVLYRRGPSSVAEIAEGIDRPPSLTALRTLLRILEGRGYVRRALDGRRNVYRPAIPKPQAAGSALRQVLETFFGGSVTDAVAAHFSAPDRPIDREEFERLARLVRDLRTGDR
jgi:predicted transcriptional regulator